MRLFHPGSNQPKRMAGVSPGDRGSIEFRFDTDTREFILFPRGPRPLSLCRGIRGSKFCPVSRTVRLPEVFWGSLSKFCARLGITPKILQAYENCTPREIPEREFTLSGGIVLRDYQVLGASLLTLPGGVRLGDQMGLGKTVQALAAYKWLRDRGQVTGATVVGPVGILGQWKEEASRIIGEDAFILDTVEDVLNMPDHGLVIVGYPKTYRDPYQAALYKFARKNRDRFMLVLDEAHKSGSIKTQTHQALYMLAQDATYRVVMSGTEIRNQPNSALPLYRLTTLSSIDGDTYRAYYSQSRGDWDIDTLSEMQAVFARLGLRRTQAEVLADLPPLTETLVLVEPTEEQQQMVERITSGRQLFKREADGEIVAIEGKGTLSTMTRLLQIYSHPLLLGGSGNKLPKFYELGSILSSTDPSDQVIVWSYRPEVCEWLSQVLSKMNYSNRVVHGGTDRTQRDKIRAEFWDGEFRVLIANPQAYAEGVNLQCANIVVYWDENWAKDTWEQSLKRAYRIGQDKPVFVYYLRVKDSLEMYCYEWVRKKKEMAEAMTGDPEGV